MALRRISTRFGDAALRGGFVISLETLQITLSVGAEELAEEGEAQREVPR